MPVEKLYNPMLIAAGVIPDETITRLQTEALAAEARALGFGIADVKKIYQHPVEKALRSVRADVKDNLPPLTALAEIPH